MTQLDIMQNGFMNGQDLEYFPSTVWAIESSSSRNCISILWNLYLCHPFFVIWKCFWSSGSFQTGHMTRSTHCVFNKVESQIKDKLWFHLSGLPETCVMNTSWDLSLDFERPAITGHSHYSLIWQKGCLSTNPSKSTEISKSYF